MTNATKVEELALLRCAQEPVHLPSRIQTFGALAGFDLASQECVYASVNLGQILGVEAPLGMPIQSLLPARLLHELRNTLGHPKISQIRERIGCFPIGSQNSDIAVHTVDDVLVVEIEPLEGVGENLTASIAQLHSFGSMLVIEKGLQDLLESAVGAFRMVTGFDRVMAYRFLENGDGEVVAEARSPGVDPFLGLRYPAHDIPPQVRAIALQCPFRMIGQVNDDGYDIEATRVESLDLTRCHLRAVSPIHIEYLTNMKVQASMNVSIIVRGELWGLIAFHHYQPRILEPDKRSVCELMGQLISLQVQQEMDREILDRRRRVSSACGSIRKSTKYSLNEQLQALAFTLSDGVEADGFVFLEDGNYVEHGSVPSREVIGRLISRHDDSDSFVADCLNEIPGMEELDGNVAGFISFTISDDAALLFFRNETIEHVRWGGAPDEKRIEFGPNGPRLHPRASFDEYREAVEGRCTPWTPGDFSAATDIRAAIVDVLARGGDSEASDEDPSLRQRDLLIAELNHRVKNVLTLVQSIIRQTESDHPEVIDFATALQARIAALASVQQLVTGSDEQWTDMRKLIEAELLPYRRTHQRVSLDGVPVGIQMELAPIVSLLIHELATNAAKYGALRGTDADLHIEWRVDAAGMRLNWVESGLSEIESPQQPGFGLSLIERAVPFECRGKAELDFQPTGLHASFWFPEEGLKFSSTEQAHFSVSPSGGLGSDQAKEPVKGRVRRLDNVQSILVVEDSMVVAMDLEETIYEAGVKKVFTAASEIDGRRIVADESIEAVVLDIKLSEKLSFDFAAELLAAGLPVIFLTGYTSQFDAIPESLQKIPLISKPLDPLLLVTKISELLEQTDDAPTST